MLQVTFDAAFAVNVLTVVPFFYIVNVALLTVGIVGLFAVNRAKWLLISSLGMSEPEAHRYIEKQAMDRCVPKGVIADEIIRTYS